MATEAKEKYFVIEDNKEFKVMGMTVKNLKVTVGVHTITVSKKTGQVSAVLIPGAKLKKKGDAYMVIPEDTAEQKEAKASKRAEKRNK